MIFGEKEKKSGKYLMPRFLPERSASQVRGGQGGGPEGDIVVTV